jgi:hypothetical protein
LFLEASAGKLLEASNLSIIVINPAFTPPIVVLVGKAIEPLSFALILAVDPRYMVLDAKRPSFAYITLNPAVDEPIFINE